MIPDEIESGFTEFEKINKAMSRRWMTTVYDFFVTKPEDFLKVRGFNEKLWAIHKRNIVGCFDH